MSSNKVGGGPETARIAVSLLLACLQLSIFSGLPAFALNDIVSIAGSPVFAVKRVPVLTGRGELAAAGTAAAGTGVADTQAQADTIQKNIDNSLVAASDLSPSAVKITYVKGLPVITLGGYYITTVDNAAARASSTSPSLLAAKWANALRSAMANKASINAYVSQLSGKTPRNMPEPGPEIASADAGSGGGEVPEISGVSSSSSRGAGKSKTVSDADSRAGMDSNGPVLDAMPATAPDFAGASSANSDTGWQPMPFNSTTQTAASNSADQSAQTAQSVPDMPTSYKGREPQYQGRLVYMPAGLTIPARLATSLNSQVARPGDMVMAKTTQNITLADGVLPADSTITGQVTSASGGARMTHSGSLAIKFNSLRTPGGLDIPISAHVEGAIGKYAEAGNDTYKGESGMSRVKSSLLATALGAGAGSALGLAVGAISSGEQGLGRGAWAGAAIGGGLGLAESLLWRRGHDVSLEQGQLLNLQLDSPVTIAMN